jgi:hypothetical protein
MIRRSTCAVVRPPSAREILAFLKLSCVVRMRRQMRSPLGRANIQILTIMHLFGDLQKSPLSFKERGTVVEQTTEGADDHIEKLSQKYLGQKYPWRQPGQQRVILRIKPHHVMELGVS